MRNHKADARMFKAFCDENRLKILELLCNGEQCACMLLEELNISQSTLSHHMRILCDSGIVNGRKEGKWMYYSISKEGQKCALKALAEITDAPEVQVKAQCCCS